ncbi:Superoxide dismutase [Cu-Zn] [Polyrhizophydium stewartii]|uniref:Superoxide dismutase [Cu-Zn] n=1 Tax=Polyrhizophydium stewartii TaxID=2732419 RepID=A0ABR4NFH7_9FUNG
MVKAVCVIKGDSTAKGTITLVQHSESPPPSTSSCPAPPPASTASTSSHFNPFGHTHGAPEDSVRHVGDLGNVIVGQDGTVKATITDAHVKLIGIHSVIGRTIVLHADEDDLGKTTHELSKTTGNAGGRIACGVIGITKE